MARRAVSDVMSGSLREDLARSACAYEMIVHSHLRWHYKMPASRAMLRHHGVRESMSRKGNSFDNAVIESLFGTIEADYYNLEKCC